MRKDLAAPMAQTSALKVRWVGSAATPAAMPQRNYTYTCIHDIHAYQDNILICVYIYIHIQNTMYLHISMCIYIYIYTSSIQLCTTSQGTTSDQLWPCRWPPLYRSCRFRWTPPGPSFPSCAPWRRGGDGRIIKTFHVYLPIYIYIHMYTYI